MAGARINIDSSVELKAALGFLRLDPKAVNADVGEYLLGSIERRFRAQKDPEGNDWKPLSEMTLASRKRRKKTSTKILIESGNLKGLMHWRATDEAVEVGTNLIYGAMQQFGGYAKLRGKPVYIPPRPYLGLSAQDRDEVQNIVIDNIERGLEKKL